MKPRLYKFSGLWVCYAREGGMRKAAAGATPRDAYNNWRTAYA